MTDARTQQFDGVRLLLPESWWTVDLREEAGRRRAIAALVDERVGRQDDRAALRADARRHLTQTADEAAAAGGQLMALSFMTIDEVPVPASLTLLRVPLPTVDGSSAMDAVVSALSDGPEGARVERGEGPLGPLVRRIGTRHAPADLGGDALPLLVVDYWLDPGDGRGLLDLTFSTPLVQVEDAIVGLFDAIVASVAPSRSQPQELP